MNKFIVLAGFQGTWFISVMGAAHELYWIGPVTAVCWLLIYAWLSGSLKREILLSVTAGLIGFCVDTILIWLDAFVPNGISGSLRISPAWMIGLWLNFATSLNSLFSWLKERYLLSALLGLFGGPAAYYSGTSLGAAAINQPFLENVILIGVAWGISMPLLIWLSERIR